MSQIETQAYRFVDDGRFPNNALPLIVYHKVLVGEEAAPEAFEDVLAANGWPPRWRYTVYDYHHFHSTSHEALGVARGTARLMFGGPAGETLDVQAGDGVLVPAGVGHMRVEASPDFLVVGAYPPGMDTDMLTGEDGERPVADERIARVPRPETDPFTGAVGGLSRHWR